MTAALDDDEQAVESAVARLTQAGRMLSEARSIADLRNVRDIATSLRAWARSRGLGVESENAAAEFILRAERGAGKELARMAETGERSGRGWPKGVPHDEHGRIPEGPGAWDQGVTLGSLGISGNDAMYWMALAAMQDDAFEAAIADALKPGPAGRVRRLAKAAFYRLARPAKVYAQRGDPLTPFDDLHATVEGFLAAGMADLPAVDVVDVGKMGVRLVRAARAELDRRGVS